MESSLTQRWTENDENPDAYTEQLNSTELQLNSTEIVPPTSGTTKKCELKISPIPREDGSGGRRFIVPTASASSSKFEIRMSQFKSRGESPLASSAFRTPLRPKNTSRVQKFFSQSINEIEVETDSGYAHCSASNVVSSNIGDDQEDEQPGHSTPKSLLTVSNLSVLNVSKVTNPFDSLILERIHANTFSPGVFERRDTTSEDLEFKWSIDEISNLRPVEFSPGELSKVFESPDPVVDARFHQIIDDYWRNGTCHVPSPDNPPPVVADTPQSDIIARQVNMMRDFQESPVIRPNRSFSRRSSFYEKQATSRSVQTELTIPPSADLDLEKILGSQYFMKEEQADDAVNTSISSVRSLRRRLFDDDSFDERSTLNDSSRSEAVVSFRVADLDDENDPENRGFAPREELDLSPIRGCESKRPDLDLSPIRSE